MPVEPLGKPLKKLFQTAGVDELRGEAGLQGQGAKWRFFVVFADPARSSGTMSGVFSKERATKAVSLKKKLFVLELSQFFILLSKCGSSESRRGDFKCKV